MPKIALFLGAGASRPFGFPTVNEFFEKTNWERDSKGTGYKTTTAELARRIWISRGKEEVCPFPSFNSEWLLEDLQKIVDTERLSKTTWNIQERTAHELLTFLKREVVHIFGQKVEEKDTSIAYLPLIKGLNDKIGIKGPLKVFTTNYDTIIETFFRNLDSKDLDVQFIDGFKEVSDSGLREWSGKEYQSPQDGDKLRIELFKLHGSVTWKWDAEKVVDLG